VPEVDIPPVLLEAVETFEEKAADESLI